MAPMQRFEFGMLSHPLTCAPATINWTYAGTQDFVMFTVAFASQDLQVPATQDFYMSIIAPNISTYAQTWTWPSVDVAGGPYVLSAVGPHFGATSLPFFVTNGTDTTCIAAVNGTVVSSFPEQPPSSMSSSSTSFFSTSTPMSPSFSPTTLFEVPLQSSNPTTTTSVSASTLPGDPISTFVHDTTAFGSFLLTASLSSTHTSFSNAPSASVHSTPSAHLDAGIVGSIIGGAFGFATLSLAIHRLFHRRRTRSSSEAVTTEKNQTANWDPLPSAPAAHPVTDEEYEVTALIPHRADSVTVYSNPVPSRRSSPELIHRPPHTFAPNPRLEAPRRHKSVPRLPKLDMNLPAARVGAPMPRTRESILSVYALANTLAFNSEYRHSRHQSDSSCSSSECVPPDSPVPSSAPSRMYLGGESP